MSFDFTSSHVENIELVLVTVEAEHVGDSDISSVDIVVQCQGGIDRNVCTRDLKLKAVDEICEGLLPLQVTFLAATDRMWLRAGILLRSNT